MPLLQPHFPHPGGTVVPQGELQLPAVEDVFLLHSPIYNFSLCTLTLVIKIGYWLALLTISTYGVPDPDALIII